MRRHSRAMLDVGALTTKLIARCDEIAAWVESGDERAAGWLDSGAARLGANGSAELNLPKILAMLTEEHRADS